MTPAPSVPGPSPRGPHIHRFYLQKPYQCLKAKSPEKSPCVSGKGKAKTTLLKCVQTVHNKGLLSKGKTYNSLFQSGERAISQLKHCLIFMSHLTGMKTLRNTSEGYSPGFTPTQTVGLNHKIIDGFPFPTLHPNITGFL